MAFMAFLGYVNIFLVRNSINLAIVAMVNYTAVNYNVPIIDNTTKPGAIHCEVHSENFTGKNEDGPFVWSQPIQALISTSFLWGYITTNIPGGRLAEVVGTKYLLTGSMLLTSVLTVLVPPAAYLGWQYVVFIRVLMGIALGPSFPSMHPMIAKWIPPTERSTISALVYGGAELGTVSGLLLTGFIIENIGWEAVFYIEGCFGVVWAVFWLLIVHDNPEEHPRISEKEKTYIKTQIAKDAHVSNKNQETRLDTVHLNFNEIRGTVNGGNLTVATVNGESDKPSTITSETRDAASFKGTSLRPQNSKLCSLSRFCQQETGTRPHSFPYCISCWAQKPSCDWAFTKLCRARTFDFTVAISLSFPLFLFSSTITRLLTVPKSC
ncbi:putative inorganic phosphate cotransporter [Artemia franciscana]|uniref:putative inorganic phosphate cotransporter n=1 Tax=Artemia franciscana TaxID=6661 RepID=UPI0032D9B9D6